jgi:putative heme transporter
MLRAWGFPSRDSSRAMVVTGIWNNLTNFGLPVVALSILTLRGGRNAALETAARVGGLAFLLGVAACVAVFRSDRGARRVGGLVDRSRSRYERLIAQLRKRDHVHKVRSGPDTFSAFREESIGLVKRRWLALTVTTLVGVLSVFLVLVCTSRALGIPRSEVSATELFAGWALTRLLSSIPITPGGLGFIEVGLTGALTSFGGTESKVVATVLIYRAVTYLPPIVLGGLAALTWRLGQPKPKLPSS